MSDRPRYLLCPQCGARRLFAHDAAGQRVYIYVTWEQQVLNAKTGEPIEVELDLDRIGCADCSWVGPLRKLVKYLS